MAAPNIVNVTQIYGQTAGIAVTTSAQDLLANGAASGKVLKVNTLIVANIDGSNAADVNVSFVDASASVTYRIASTISVPADASLVVISKDNPIYLEEGDKITISAGSAGDLEAVVSWEEIG